MRWELGSDVDLGVKTRGRGINGIDGVDDSPDQVACLVCDPVAESNSR